MTAARYFNKHAAAYDALSATADWQPNERMREALVDLDRRPGRILDLGCGTGRTTAMLADLYPDAAITAIDVSRQMVRRTRQRVPAASVRRRRITSPRLQGPFDLIVSVGVFEYVSGFPGVLTQVSRRLSPGGDLLFTHEPVIPDDPRHADQTTLSFSRRRYARSLTTYRQTPASVHEAVAAAGLSCHPLLRFEAYHYPGVSVFYDLIHAHRAV